MCGIVAYTGKSESANKLVIQGLRRLEYRGYDSWGIAFKELDKTKIFKQKGKISANTDELEELKTNISIGHTRWATHGKANEKNAHPHYSKPVSIVHNGIIENHKELERKYKLKKESETDSEILSKLISMHLTKNNFKEAVIKTLEEIKGSFALIVLNDNDEKLIVAKKKSPLAIGIGEQGFFIASDTNAFIEHTNKVIFLEDGELAEIAPNKVHIFKINKPSIEIKQKIKTMDYSISNIEKKGFKHFMLKEIFEQPEAINKTIKDRLEKEDVKLPELDNLDLETIKELTIIACGTSWHAGLVGEFMIESIARIPVNIEYASEFKYKKPLINKGDIVIAISQSGETADTLSAIKEAKKLGAKIISICNVKQSSIPRESDYSIYTLAGPEIGVASTKAFTTQIIIFYLLAIKLGKIKNKLTKKQLRKYIEQLKEIPEKIELILKKNKTIKSVAKTIKDSSNALFLGRGIQFPIALEGALKLKEVSYIHAEGYPAAEMKHGPIALIDEKMPVIFLATKDKSTFDKILGNIEEVKTRKGKIISIIDSKNEELEQLSEQIIKIPRSNQLLEAILSIIPLQLLAYHVASLRGCDVDKPRNLAKSVTVE